MKLAVAKDLVPLKAAAKKRIDDEAEAKRLVYITPGAGQALTYKAKLDEAERFLASGTIGPLIEAEIGIRGMMTAADVVAVWQQNDALWRSLAGQIERARLLGKDAVDAAASPAEIEVAVAAIVWPF